MNNLTLQLRGLNAEQEEVFETQCLTVCNTIGLTSKVKNVDFIKAIDLLGEELLIDLFNKSTDISVLNDIPCIVDDALNNTVCINDIVNIYRDERASITWSSVTAFLGAVKELNNSECSIVEALKRGYVKQKQLFENNKNN